MIELPEAAVLAEQLNETVRGKRISAVAAGASPHKFAWFHGDPGAYGRLLRGKTMGLAASYGGLVEIEAEDMRLVFSDGVALRLHGGLAVRPGKHQLLLEFEDSSALSASVQMYGGLLVFKAGAYDNRYYDTAKEAPSPLSAHFSSGHFERLIHAPEVQKLSAKAFLATEQRIPGLGNGVLQDILYEARVHPKQKVNTLSAGQRKTVFAAIKSVLKEMRERGGRDTEKDLAGNPGGYATRLSKNTVGQPCRRCGSAIVKESYLGGAVYYCRGCQQLE